MSTNRREFEVRMEVVAKVQALDSDQAEALALMFGKTGQLGRRDEWTVLSVAWNVEDPDAEA